jgi:hypothetical protein
MMSKKDLHQLAQAFISSKIANGETVQMDWAVQEIIGGRGEIAGRGVPFYELCAREYVYEVVKREVARYDETDTNEVPEQMVFEGYEHLRVAYTVLRDGGRVLVPLADLSDDELKARGEEFRVQAIGLNEHAREIDRYVAARS